MDPTLDEISAAIRNELYPKRPPQTDDPLPNEFADEVRATVAGLYGQLEALADLAERLARDGYNGPAEQVDQLVFDIRFAVEFSPAGGTEVPPTVRIDEILSDT